MLYETFKDKKKFSYKYVIPALIEADEPERALKLQDCGNYKSVAVCSHCYTTYFAGANSCKDRFCPVCQKKRSLLWFSKVYPILSEITKRDKKYKLDMLTFTITDCENLKQNLDILYKAFRYLMHDEKGLASQFNQIYIGGLRALEVKRGKNSKLWHSHFHVLFLKYDNKQNNFDFLMRAWKHSVKIVSQTPLITGSVDVKYLKSSTDEELKSSICECIKYLTKNSFEEKAGTVSINPTDLKEMCHALDGVRSLVTFGCLRELISEKDIEKEMNITEEDLTNRVCQACGNDNFILLKNISAKNLNLNDFTENYTI